MTGTEGGLTRPRVSIADAQQVVSELWGLVARATELGSNQDRNFLIECDDGTSYVLRIDNAAFPESARNAQHAAVEAYRAAGIPVPSFIPGLDGNLTQHWGEHAARLSEFVVGESMVELGYFSPQVLRSFGAMAAASVSALADLEHPGLMRVHQWDMRVAYEETMRVIDSIQDDHLRERVRRVADEARDALRRVARELPVQAIHGDLTDDNVMGRRESDSRIHPHTLIDFGDLSLGWRVAEIAVTVTSMLHHTGSRPLHALHAVEAFNQALPTPLTPAEAVALWPLVNLRASLLVASAHRQLELEPDNDYARERLPGEIQMFQEATTFSLKEMIEHVLALTDSEVEPPPLPPFQGGALLSCLPTLDGRVAVLDPSVESRALDAGVWLLPDAEERLVNASRHDGARAVVFPQGVFRLTRTTVDRQESPRTWPASTEIRCWPQEELPVTSPIEGTVTHTGGDTVSVESAGWVLDISGFTVSSTLKHRSRVQAGDAIGSVGPHEAGRTLVVCLRRSDAAPGPGLIEPERVPAFRRMYADPAAILGLPSMGQKDEARREQARREHIFASAQERYYERPMQVERGWKHHLIDTTGRAYIDMVNNVTGLGHGHAGVADAVDRQIRLLGTNSRFLYRSLAEYSERLLELLPEDSGLDTVLLVNSGSEAVDLALRLAQAATERQTVIALREAYHGWTMASDAVTTSAFDNPHALDSRPDWVHIADVPNSYRGTYRGPHSGKDYLRDLQRDLERLNEEGRPVAGFICESVLGNAGGVTLPDGYLAGAYELVRAAGGLAIADEVQVGFGRMGTSFWGFEQSGVRPDIIAIAKPMGNGFPIGGVITSKRVADALATQGQFFSSAGGNPVSCAAGLAVLDAMRDEGLQENARVVGEYLVRGFELLGERHQLIGPVHGEGLYLGVELVRDRDTREPATAEAEAICERLRELGVIVLTTSERSNVLKIKPPLCLTTQSADAVLLALDRVLTEGW